jgi:2Fe-2S ferredoxin
MSMTTITFIHPDGRSQSFEANSGSVMQLAVTNSVDEIVAECGGNAMCATCHVYVDDSWVDRLPAVSDAEDALLDGTASDRLPTSRLSCQIKIAPELDGLVLRLPDRQV